MEAFSNTVNLFVDFRSVMVTLLSHPGHRVCHAGGMPRSNASDFPQTFVCLSWQLFDMPTSDDTFDSFSFRYSNDVHHFVLREDVFDGDSLLEKATGEVNFIWYRAAVQLDFVDVSLFF